jgi:hypothetical protein
MTGEGAQGEKGGKENRIGKGPLKDHFRNLKDEVLKNKEKRGLMLDENIHFLKEEDDDIDEDQTAQTETEDLEIFTYDIAVKHMVTFNHLQRILSMSSG